MEANHYPSPLTHNTRGQWAKVCLGVREGGPRKDPRSPQTKNIFSAVFHQFYYFCYFSIRGVGKKKSGGMWVCIFLGIQRFREGRKFIKNVPSTKVGKINSSLSLSLFFFFFNLNCVTGEILSQGESVPEPSLGLGKIFQHVRNEADGPLRRKKKSTHTKKVLEESVKRRKLQDSDGALHSRPGRSERPQEAPSKGRLRRCTLGSQP